MANTLMDFGDTATKLARNPLGILALFQVLIYGIAGYVTANIGASGSELLQPLVWFLIIFPMVVLGVFTYLVIAHHRKLYAPSDFANEDNFMRAVERGLKQSPTIAELEGITEAIRIEIDSVPMFQFAKLPSMGQCFVKRLYHANEVKIDEYSKDLDACKIPPLKETIEVLKSNLNWIEVDGEKVSLTPKGKEALDSFIELTIPRLY
jgi:hypothetical protein